MSGSQVSGAESGTLFRGCYLHFFSGGVAAQFFGYYITEFATYSVTYAGLASVMAALIFLYLMAALFILGAEFNGRLIAGQMERAGPG